MLHFVRLQVGRLVLPALLLVLASGPGCDRVRFRGWQAQPASKEGSPAAQQSSPPRESTAAADTAAVKTTDLDKPAPQRVAIDDDLRRAAANSGVSFDFSPSSAATPTARLHHPGLEKRAAAELVLNLIRESVEYKPTLVVWLIDRSRSAVTMSRELCELISHRYGRLTEQPERSDRAQNARLLTAVCAFGASVEFPLELPSAEQEVVTRALATVGTDSTGREMTFTAIRTCLHKYLKYRTEQHRELLLLLVTDEAGDDQLLVEQIIPVTRRAGVPLYVLGVPAPLGRLAALDALVEAPAGRQRRGDWQPIRQGPETLYAERLQLGFSDGATGLEFIDSGFGPYALEYLCRTSGGRFLALRPHSRSSALAYSGEWPAFAAYSFPPEVMRRYTPDYISSAEYEQLLESNAARRALNRAAQIGGLEVVEFPQTKFSSRSEADLSRQLRLAQQAAAKLEPLVQTMLSVLEEGEADRARLTGPRWQAAYDLALGRATAAKARIDGYNLMLAALKRGQEFQHPNSTIWVLQPAESFRGHSRLRRLVDKSRTVLERVVDQHPDTPWAALASHELSLPAGWQWSEQ